MAYVDGDRTAKWVVAISVLIFLAAALIVKQYSSANATSTGSSLHYIALWVACALMWIAGIYCIYLVVSSVGTGSFPGPKSKLPVRSRLSFGAMAIIYRSIMIVTAVSLILFPVIAILYVTTS